MTSELILKFKLTASHSLSGYETPHPHLWKIEVIISGEPKDGKILDLVQLRQSIENILDRLSSVYLNEAMEVSEEVRRSPTCETLSQYFWDCIEQMLKRDYLHLNPSIHLDSILVAICDLDRNELGAVRVLNQKKVSI